MQFSLHIVFTGVPETGSVQEVLQWQTCTVRMMYAIIGAALQDVNSENIPTDYLAFFCLGKSSGSNICKSYCLRYPQGAHFY